MSRSIMAEVKLQDSRSYKITFVEAEANVQGMCHLPYWIVREIKSRKTIGKVYEKNEWRKHFWTACCDFTAQL